MRIRELAVEEAWKKESISRAHWERVHLCRGGKGGEAACDQEVRANGNQLPPTAADCKEPAKRYLPQV
jgi:hypothetical protein